MTKAFDSALRLLSRREHGAAELCDKLLRKGFASAEVDLALAKCHELDLQSDRRFVESYIRWRVRQGFGPLKIGQELKARGVDGDLIQEGLQQERDNWLGYALEVWRKKSRGLELSAVEVLQQQKFLLYRGFSGDVVALVLREMR